MKSIRKMRVTFDYDEDATPKWSKSATIVSADKLAAKGTRERVEVKSVLTNFPTTPANKEIGDLQAEILTAAKTQHSIP